MIAGYNKCISKFGGNSMNSASLALLEKAQARLSRAPNLCGIAGMMTEFDPMATHQVLLLALKGGWLYGLLPLFLDVSFFLEKDANYCSGHGNFKISELIALLMDAMARDDHESINNAIIALKQKNA
jgi:hypothetical protein